MSPNREAIESGGVATLPNAPEATPTSTPAAMPAEHHPCVLFATNGSPEANAALRFAAALAWRDGLLLRVLTVLEPLPAFPAQGSVAAYEITIGMERAEGILERVRADLAKFAAMQPALTSMLVGTPGTSIAEAARQWRARYIILGAGKHGALERMLTGDTVVRVLRHSAAPVIAVPAPAGTLPRTGIVAVDFGPASIAAAKHAATVIGSGALHLVHVRPEVDVPATDPHAWAEVYESGAQSLLKKLTDDLRTSHPDIRTDTTLVRGHPSKVLLDQAEEIGVDLIAVGQHGHGTVERFLFGSVAHAIVRSAKCAVLVAPPVEPAE